MYVWQYGQISVSHVPDLLHEREPTFTVPSLLNKHGDGCLLSPFAIEQLVPVVMRCSDGQQVVRYIRPSASILVLPDGLCVATLLCGW